MNNVYQNLNQAFLESIMEIHEYASVVEARGMKTKEIIGKNFLIQDPTDLNITIPQRKFSSKYAITEWLWYISKNRKVNNIEKFANTWYIIKDEKGEVESNYGTYMGTQWAWVLRELYDDPQTRRATFAINQPHHKGSNSQDYPCTQYLQFMIRDNKLHMFGSMRSNDAVYGFCNDVFTFALFQQLMLNELNTRGRNYELGNYYHSANSFHVYEKHFELVESIAKDDSLISLSSDSKFVLKPKVTWNYLLLNEFYLPIDDSTKEEMNYIVKHIIGEIFE
jgi:thymidylate synthase